MLGAVRGVGRGVVGGRVGVRWMGMAVGKGDALGRKIEEELRGIREAGTYKTERVIKSAQSSHITVASGKEVRGCVGGCGSQARAPKFAGAFWPRAGPPLAPRVPREMREGGGGWGEGRQRRRAYRSSRSSDRFCRIICTWLYR